MKSRQIYLKKIKEFNAECNAEGVSSTDVPAVHSNDSSNNQEIATSSLSLASLQQKEASAAKSNTEVIA